MAFTVINPDDHQWETLEQCVASMVACNFRPAETYDMTYDMKSDFGKLL